MTLKKIKFPTDMIYDGVVKFEAGKTYEVEVETGSFQRWIKRGAEEVLELAEVKVDSKEDNKEEVENKVAEVVEKVVPAHKTDGKNKNKNKEKIDL